ncbi:alpha/beta fold hydrolase [Tersicoccus sp. Bi-70]|uniref:alpha/beta fold hydrolase n=1 Tax=Tersicoccus sp. Bi-70 TaxID=1897634 RepID=UPI000978C911|nr:alpha/beta fold hydrolase [Tersicoccus sp. Bi-70]OMH37164.1 hydrolase [Tersicoccus sp. Bi-70]
MVTSAWPGVPEGCSRYLPVTSSAAVDAGAVHRWHLLDNAALIPDDVTPAGTLLCVHGNPTWGYLWRSLLEPAARRIASEGGPWRVIAVDQLDMGFSARTGPRRLADRVTDLGDLTDALGLTGPVVTVGHDWGGSISLGWAVDHPDALAGVVLTNTAVHQPDGESLPWPLRLALHPAIHRPGTVTTTAFLDITLGLARPALDPAVRRAYRTPYRHARRRGGVGQFVADIPVDAATASFPELDRIAEGVRGLDVPALLLWGPEDPIFADRYLRDLVDRLPHADVHRFEGAGHLVIEDAPVAETLLDWLGERLPADRADADQLRGSRLTLPDRDHRPLWATLEERAADTAVAVVDMAGPGGRPMRLSWQDLAARVDRLRRGLLAVGVRPGHRISLLVPPGIDLTCLIYAGLRLGAVIVVADAGLGPRGLSRAVRGAGPDWVIGIDRALVAARAFNWPGRRISVRTPDPVTRRVLGVDHSLAEVLAAGDTAGSLLQHEPQADDLAAILFTSGSTGPAKGVAYTHRQLSAMCRAVSTTYGLAPGTALVAAFAPFALLGPALGATSVSPAMDVTAPATLTATALADAAAAIEATTVFASPAALVNVLATAGGLDARHRDALDRIDLLLSAGAPIGEPLLAAVSTLVPQARLHTPYGMTEALPITDIDLPGIRAAAADAQPVHRAGSGHGPGAAPAVAGAGNGVCVGAPVPGAHVAISAFDEAGSAVGDPSGVPGVSGEILVAAPHVKDHYDRLHRTETAAFDRGWHRTGDVGHLDAAGRLWVEGRLQHVLRTSSGPVTPVEAEQRMAAVDGVARTALVGVGPVGAQVAVAVVETVPGARSDGPAPRHTADALRSVLRSVMPELDLAAVLQVRRLPTDIRHNSKVDRSALARWASGVLAGERVSAP